MIKRLNAGDLAKQFQMEVVSGEAGLNRFITVAELHRPGLEMAGYFDYHPQERVQILGKTELAFFETLTKDQRYDRMSRLCADVVPCIVITRGLEAPKELQDLANERRIPVIRSNITTTTLASKITYFLENKLAPSTTIHGVLVDVYGIGILISGSSGIGKSETALELVKRGHLLIADDAVEMRQTAPNVLIGNAPELIKHLLEIRGVGIINVMTLFGAGAVRNNTKISIVVNLEIWQQDKQYDRLGLEEETTRIIDTDVTMVTIPVRPGRNLSVIVEVVAMNFRLKRMGFNAAQQFTNKLTESLNAGQLGENEDWD